MESKEIRVMRTQAWERAKGELKAMEHTYWDHDGRYNKFNSLMEKFVKEVEDQELQG
jgi:hypothetical protein